MSRVVLGWQLKRSIDERDIAAIARQVKARYQPLFEAPIHHTGQWNEHQGLLHFDVLSGPRPDRYEDDERVICLNGKPSITDNAAPGGAQLFGAKDLYDRFHDSSAGFNPRVLHQINPPFTLCWFNKQRQEIGLAHDGMGADQFFIAETGAGLVFSNKCWPILQLLGEAAEINHAAWQFWFSLGWFPGSSTPFRNVRHLDPGEFVQADGKSVTRDREDTFRSWIRPGEGGFPVELADRARSSVKSLILLNRPSGSPYGSDLTGGLDSRTICSFLISLSTPCAYWTGGPNYSADVVLARRIALQFQLEWQHRADRSDARDAGTPQVVNAQFEKLLLWGEGLAQPNRFDHFQLAPRGTSEESYLSGATSEISRCPYYRDHLTRGADEETVYRKALSRYEARVTAAPLSPDGVAEGVRLIREQLARADPYPLGALARLDFLYFSEKMRRWPSAHRAVNLFDRAVVPFLTIEHIQLAFAMEPIDKAAYRFQRYIIGRNVPALLQIPFADSRWFRLRTRALESLSRMKAVSRAVRPLGWADYLRHEGRPEIDRILSSDTPLWEVLDRDRSRAKWNRFLNGADQQHLFPLGLMAFEHWRAQCDALPR